VLPAIFTTKSPNLQITNQETKAPKLLCSATVPLQIQAMSPDPIKSRHRSKPSSAAREKTENLQP
jgi:hypothetical protein